MFKLFVLLSLTVCECVYLYSSFWAPRMLNYKVDVGFEPSSGQIAAKDFENAYGYRGSKLIADLGNGKGPGVKHPYDPRVYGDVQVYSVPRK